MKVSIFLCGLSSTPGFCFPWPSVSGARGGLLAHRFLPHLGSFDPSLFSSTQSFLCLWQNRAQVFSASIPCQSARGFPATRFLAALVARHQTFSQLPIDEFSPRVVFFQISSARSASTLFLSRRVQRFEFSLSSACFHCGFLGTPAKCLMECA
jgi:hypothetical protein